MAWNLLNKHVIQMIKKFYFSAHFINNGFRYAKLSVVLGLMKFNK